MGFEELFEDYRKEKNNDVINKGFIYEKHEKYISTLSDEKKIIDSLNMLIEIINLRLLKATIKANAEARQKIYLRIYFPFSYKISKKDAPDLRKVIEIWK